MPIYANFTRYAAGEMVGLGTDGAEAYVLVLKATFGWTREGHAYELEEPQLVVEADVYSGALGTSSPLLESDFVPYKPRVDVLLLGEIVLPTAVEQADVALRVGQRIHKKVRVFGDRYWLPGYMQALSYTRPQPFDRMAITWERSFGGTDPDDPQCTEPRNPVGVGMRRTAKALESHRVANFESPGRCIGGWKDRPPPAGFGPIGRHWQPRARFAGTYDAAWQEERFPLCPLDFDHRFFNCAPADQQLDNYLPGEEVNLTYMTVVGRERFLLPKWQVPVTIVEKGGRRTSLQVHPDTIAIEPAERRFSLVGRLRHVASPSALAIQDVFVGTPWPGWIQAQRTRKTYLGRDPRAPR
jgi:hypothetical protein